MTSLDPIDLNTEWRVYPLTQTNPTYVALQLDDSTWDPLVNIEDWPRHLIAREKIVYLHNRFDLEPMGDVCLRFILVVDDAPDGTEVFLNKRHLGTYYGEERFSIDVTDYLTLEDNLLRFEVRKVGPFSYIRLRRVPCAEQ